METYNFLSCIGLFLCTSTEGLKLGFCHHRVEPSFLIELILIGTVARVAQADLPEIRHGCSFALNKYLLQLKWKIYL